MLISIIIFQKGRNFIYYTDVFIWDSCCAPMTASSVFDFGPWFIIKAQEADYLLQGGPF